MAVVAIAGLFAVGCGGDDSGSSSGSAGKKGGAAEVVQVLAERAEAEFKSRGQGTFIDTGFAIYCRMNSGFDEGVFKTLGYSQSTAPKNYEVCYNVSSDRKKVALAATSSKGGKPMCLVLDATTGSVKPGTAQEVERCQP